MQNFHEVAQAAVLAPSTGVGGHHKASTAAATASPATDWQTPVSCTLASMTSNKTKAPSEPLYKAMIAAGLDYRPWESQGLDDDECFVCTKTIGDGERTTEDVIPRWILRKLRKRGMQCLHLLLPNLTQIPVNKILLPACQAATAVTLAGSRKRLRRRSRQDQRRWQPCPNGLCECGTRRSPTGCEGGTCS
jgi:hypothetical protein